MTQRTPILDRQTKQQILLVSPQELLNTDAQYGQISTLYPEVFKHIRTLVEECQKFKLPAQILDVRERRTTLKDLSSLKDKILRKRAQGWKENRDDYKGYSLASMTDIIGVKILCGYLTDQPHIERWIEDTFDVVDREPITYASGYTSWHYIVKLKEQHMHERGLPREWARVLCELQVKTVLQAAWDDKTHNLVYKQEDVSEYERIEFGLLSRSLQVADEQSEMIRLEIEEMRREVAKRRAAALAHYLSGTDELALEIGYLRTATVTAANICTWLERLTQYAEEIERRTSADRREAHRVLLRLSVRMALETLKQEVRECCLNYCDRLHGWYPSDPAIWRFTSTAYWALGKKYESMDAVVRSLEIAEDQNNQEELPKCAIALVHFIADYGREDLRAVGDRFLRLFPENEPAARETEALYLIRVAQSEDELEEGKKKLLECVTLAQASGNRDLIRTAQAFCELDRLIADRKLKGIRAGATLPAAGH